jgi:DNA-binding transcriptional LysR family regulator
LFEICFIIKIFGTIVTVMTRLADLELIVRTADLGSLTAAANALDWSPAAASAAVKRLETRLGAPLFVRTTRSLRLSSDGERFVPFARQALSAIESGRSSITKSKGKLTGSLHVSMPSDLGRNVLLPWLTAFQRLHPQLSLRVSLSDRLTDMTRVSVDASIRLGTPSDSSLVALPLVPDNQRLLVAAPSYLAKHRAPSEPQAMRRHQALRFVVGEDVPRHWRVRIDGTWHNVPIAGNYVSDDGEVVKRWALDGVGIAYKSWLDVGQELKSGALIHVNPTWRGEDVPLNLLVPGRDHLSNAVRRLHHYLAEKFETMTRRLSKRD